MCITLDHYGALRNLILDDRVAHGTVVGSCQVRRFSSSISDHRPHRRRVRTTRRLCFARLVYRLFSFGGLRRHVRCTTFIICKGLRGLCPRLDIRCSGAHSTFHSAIASIKRQFVRRLGQLVANGASCLGSRAVRRHIQGNITCFLRRVSHLYAPLRRTSGIRVSGGRAHGAVGGTLSG